MKILLAAKHPPRPPNGKLSIGGVQTWCRTVADQLIAMGHKVSFWGPDEALPDVKFDIGIFSNPIHTIYARHLCAKICAISHGIITDEKPFNRLPIAYTSEEIAVRWGDTDGKIIRQPIDLDFWHPDERVLKTDFVLFSYRAPNDFGLAALADRLRLPFRHINYATPEQIRPVLQSAAIVCASGRAALEAMACGAPTLIWDHRPYLQTPLLCYDIDTARNFNYSGRGLLTEHFEPVRITEEMFSHALDYEPREYVESWHDAKSVVQQLIDWL